MDRIIINEPHFADMVAQLAGAHYNTRYDRSIVRVTPDLEFVGGVIFTDYSGESVFMHSGSVTPHWLNRDMLYCISDYPFNQLNVKRVFGRVPESKPDVIAFNEKVGFKVVARIEGVFRHNIAAVIMCLEKQDCRYLNVTPSHNFTPYH